MNGPCQQFATTREGTNSTLSTVTDEEWRLCSISLLNKYCIKHFKTSNKTHTTKKKYFLSFFFLQEKMQENLKKFLRLSPDVQIADICWLRSNGTKVFLRWAPLRDVVGGRERKRRRRKRVKEWTRNSHPRFGPL